MRDRAAEWRRVGIALRVNTQPGESMVLPNLGAISYSTELFAHDPFGLVDREVARRAATHGRASPGHDKRVETTFFMSRRPDYLGAWIAPADAHEGFGLPPGFASTPLGRRTRLERRPRTSGDGLEPGEQLRVLRLVWDE